MCPSGKTLASNGNRATSSAARLDFRTAFEVLDADRDGKISRDDLRCFYNGFVSSSGGGGDGEDADDVIGSMMLLADFNKDGFVEYEEFERVLNDSNNYEKNKKERSGNGGRGGGGVMEDVFKVMDKDGDGKLSHEDLKNYMQWAGFEASDEDIKAMIKLGGGGDQNDAVSFHGLLRILSLDV